MGKSVLGNCKLTGAYGKFVKAHILPRAFTRPRPGEPFIQSGEGQGRPERRWDSWYDDRLVTDEGEAIFKALDDWACVELRAHLLVWSGWGPMTRLPAYDAIPGTRWGIRKVRVSDPARLLRFFHSLLWRAAASSRKEFAQIKVPDGDLAKLAHTVKTGEPMPAAFYPVQLTQLSTVGPTHNLTPLVQDKVVSGVEGEPDRRIPIFRFYFDGLSAHIHRHADDDGYTVRTGSLNLGVGDVVDVCTVEAEGSFAVENFLAQQRETYSTWPNVVAKLIR